MYASLNIPFEDGFELMSSQLTLDPGFTGFHKFCLGNNIPFHVISAGLKPVLRKVLDEFFLGEEESAKINVVANGVEVGEQGKNGRLCGRMGSPVETVVTIRRRASSTKSTGSNNNNNDDDDKSIMRMEKKGEEVVMPLIVFIGDGVSDLPAAREADVLFAKKGLRLEHGIKHTPFDGFQDTQKVLEGIMKENEEKTGGMGRPVRRNPKANMWRRVSSKAGVERCVVMSPTREERMFFAA